MSGQKLSNANNPEQGVEIVIGGDVALFIDHDILVSDDWIATHVRLHRQFPGARLSPG